MSATGANSSADSSASVEEVVRLFPHGWVCTHVALPIFCRGGDLQQWSLLVGGTCAVVAILISGSHVVRQCCNSAPWSIKACTLRIVAMVPLYALDACVSLFVAVDRFHLPEVLKFFREFYEAVVLCAFLQLLLNWLNGAQSVACAFTQEMQTPEHPWCLRAIPTPFSPGLRFLVGILWGLLQFALVMVAVTGTDVVMWANGVLWAAANKPIDNPENKDYAESVLKGLKTLSCSYALYTLTLFYFETMRNSHLNTRFERIRPELKFISIKLVIMFTICQTSVCKMAVDLNLFSGISWEGAKNAQATQKEIGMAITNLLVCVEMSLFAILHLWAYPAAEFDDCAEVEEEEDGSAGLRDMIWGIWRLTKQANQQSRILRRLKSRSYGGLTDAEAKEAFAAFDINGDRSITPAEFVYTLECAQVDTAGLDQLLTEVDADGDGMVTESEFKQAFRQSTAQTSWVSSDSESKGGCCA